MTKLASDTRSVIVERELPHAPHKVWRALTESPLIEDWLMKNDFQPRRGHKFTFRAEPQPYWNGVTDCEVLEIEPPTRLSYSWNASGAEAATGVKTVVTWTLTPTGSGTLLRMEQSGFRPDQDNNYQGAHYGWPKFIAGLERTVAGLGD
ncbi:MAG TPA: SRPBCC domain-containing protein [Methyloceanibacter sp.]|nr:SRPBCC domain-containing protein [Methyloceanibacter sp.]